MDCRETLLLISPHLDGALSTEEAAVLAEHVAVCKDCTRELAIQERLSGALRNMGREEIQAPQELCGLVMAKLREERRGYILWLPAVWRKAAAAVAALLILAGGYAGVTAGLSGGGKLVGYNSTVPQVNVEPDRGVTLDKTPEGSLSQPGGSVQLPDDAGNAVNTREGSLSVIDSGKVSGNSDNTGNDKGDNIDSSKAPVVTTARTSLEGSTALLSSGMKVTSTVLKVAVDDLTGARAKAVALAAGAGAETQVFPEQSGSKRIVVIRLTTTSAQAPGIISGLTRFGALVDRQDESRDITSIYNETLIQYHDLQSQASSAGDAEKQRQLEAQAASYKQQLDAWQAEAGKRVIMLWLESK